MHLQRQIEAQRRVRDVYDPDRFDADARAVTAEVSAFLRRAQASAGAVLSWAEPEQSVERAAAMLAASPDARALARISLQRCQAIHDPRYMGHQVPPPIPTAALFEAVSSVSNQGMTIYEMGPWATGVERAMIQRLGAELGLPPGFGGVVTSGGSLGNLTALLAARSAALPEGWSSGLRASARRPVILTHGESHYSIKRAAGILGLGADSCVPVAVDSRGRMDAEDLARRADQLMARGDVIVAVVASACSTRTGAYDPLKEIAAVCRARGLWMHVDAAHGGSAVFSERYAPLMEGVEHADSVVWDAHKMMFMPALATFVFYRRSDDQYRAVNQDATYLFSGAPPREGAYDTGFGTVECTKRSAVLSLWACWCLYGRQLFTDLVDVTYGLAARFADRMEEAEELELLYRPQANTLVFRYLPRGVRFDSPASLGRFQQAVRDRVARSGACYIVSAMDGGVPALRMVVMNPLTTDAHFDELLAALRRHTADALAEVSR